MAATPLQESVLAHDVLEVSLCLVPLFLLGLSHFRGLRFASTLGFFLSLLYPFYLQSPRLSVSMTTLYGVAYLGAFFVLLYWGQRSTDPLILEQVHPKRVDTEQELEAILASHDKQDAQTQRQVQAQEALIAPSWSKTLNALLFTVFWLSGLATIWTASQADIAPHVATVWTLVMTLAGQRYFWPDLISSDWLAYKTRRKAEADLNQKQSLHLRYALILLLGLSLLAYSFVNS